MLPFLRWWQRSPTYSSEAEVQQYLPQEVIPTPKPFLFSYKTVIKSKKLIIISINKKFLIKTFRLQISIPEPKHSTN